MKFATDRPYADPEKAARKLVEIANSVEAVQDGRIYIELINAPVFWRPEGIQFDCGRVPHWKMDGAQAIFRGWRNSSL